MPGAEHSVLGTQFAAPTPSPRHPVTEPRHGALAAELAILLPFIALMLVAAIDFCRVYYSTQTVQNCARSGALYASGSARRDAETTTAEEAAREAAVAEGVSLDPPLRSEDVEVLIGDSTTTVTVTYRVPMLTNYPALPGTFVVRRSVTMPLAPKVPGEK